MIANPSSSTESPPLTSSYSGPTQPIPKKSLQIRTDKPRPHVCAICTRGFARLEHLKRHERSHTNEKPFQCAACGRCFARRDLVLRHQQKLHLHITPVVRSEPTAGGPEDGVLSPPNDHIIILRNNTNAKAPLPSNGASQALHQTHNTTLAILSPSRASVSSLDYTVRPALVKSNNSDYKESFSYVPLLLATSDNLPSPHTSSSHNTPSGIAPKDNGRSMSMDESSSGHYSHPDATQEPSPLTGESPDAKKDKRPIWAPAQLDDHHLNHRHTSFSAVSGVSYANIKDALSIQSHQISDGPTQVGFATPQLTAAEIDSKGLLVVDFGSLDLDWYNPSYQDNFKINDGHKLPSFKLRLDTIPSETHLLAHANEQAAFYADPVMATHRFQDPNHPHHIPGTTPLDFSFPSASNLPLLFKENGKETPVGSGFVDMSKELDYMNKKSDRPKHQKARKRQSLSPTTAPAPKKAHTGFVNEIGDLDWVNDFKSIPLINEFPSASHDTGFLAMPHIADQFEPGEVVSLFKLRQDDLIKQRSQIDLNALSPQTDKLASSFSRPSKVKFTIGDSSDLITEELRDRMVETSNVSDDHFPPLEDLNAYINLYEAEFNTYFPFIHIPTLRNPMVDNFENTPLILSMCAIGALYSYHDNNTLLLFNLSKFHIYNFFDKEVTADKLQFKKVPIMAHQSLVLHIFISMFLNEPNLTEITMRQMTLMVGLIKSTNFHRPLELFLVPPPTITNQNETSVIQNNFDYFIMVQTRIRTIQTFYQLEVLRSSFFGTNLPLKGMEILSGSSCSDELLWKAKNASEWYESFKKYGKVSLLLIANNVPMSSFVEELRTGCHTRGQASLNKSMTMLMIVHEKILETQLAKNSNGSSFDAFEWRVTYRPDLEDLLKLWETSFIINGGFSSVNENNEQLLNGSNQLKLLFPLFSLAKIRICLNVSPVMEKVFYKDWKGMKNSLNNWTADEEALKEACSPAIEILKLWVHNVSVLSDPRTTSVRTPVYFVTCVFIAIMVIAKALMRLEESKTLSLSDKALWLKAENVFAKIENTLSPENEVNPYSVLLRSQSQSSRLFDYAQSSSLKKNIAIVRDSFLASLPLACIASVKMCKLLTLSLCLGVRVLADAPLWPVALGFAEGLKYLATSLNQNGMH